MKNQMAATGQGRPVYVTCSESIRLPLPRLAFKVGIASEFVAQTFRMLGVESRRSKASLAV